MGLTELLALKDGFILLSETVSPLLKGWFVYGSSASDLLWGYLMPQSIHRAFIFKSIPDKFLIIPRFYGTFLLFHKEYLKIKHILLFTLKYGSSVISWTLSYSIPKCCIYLHQFSTCLCVYCNYKYSHPT